ncbi:hypothetical protein E2C01_030614 [Portunus trituberculatus]|uniref:Uncharacterized protein n=1 Tax=Portunus trituberculatus TaxID=210409 RepID=A0A5B7EQW3_PORTR|nr:hypothetical protein [Portunus trituberculatus]
MRVAMGRSDADCLCEGNDGEGILCATDGLMVIENDGNADEFIARECDSGTMPPNFGSEEKEQGRFAMSIRYVNKFNSFSEVCQISRTVQID